MAKQLKLNTSWDLSITNYQLDMVSGIDQVAQHIKERLQMFYGEWFLAVDKGVDYFGKVFPKNADRTEMYNMFLREIVGTYGVTEVKSLTIETLNSAEGSIKVSFVVKAGEVTISDGLTL